MQYTEDFRELVIEFIRHDAGFPHIRSASIAQFILESARGSSLLAREHKNFAGLKWRPEMKSVATKKLVKAPSETAYFCSFETIEKFVEGYWLFLGRKPYAGWENHTTDPYDFIDFIGPIWATDPAYDEKLKDLLAEADDLIAAAGSTSLQSSADELAPCCGGMADDMPALALAAAAVQKPNVQWDPSPFDWSRDGTEIDTIVMHYTTSRSLSGTVSWFKDTVGNTAKTAAHYVIGRDGTIVQMVKDSDACTHGNSQNRRSIGIEHSAAAGDAMTASQEQSSIALVRWLMQEYSIAPKRVIGHKCAPRSTLCPGDLFKHYGATSTSDCGDVTKAIQDWLSKNVIN